MLWLATIFYLVATVICSCTNKSFISEKDVLKLTGDSLSTAVEYLFKEIPNRHTTASQALNDYYEFVDSLYNATDEYYIIKKLLTNYFDQNPSVKRRKIEDVEFLSNDYLAKTILNCYKYRNKPWNKHLSEDQFLEYTLPYKIGDEEIEDWRTMFQNKYGHILDSLESACDTITTETLCTVLVNEFKKHKPHIFNSNIYSNTTRPSTLGIMDCGTCKDYCDFVTFVFRSFGIPVATDGLSNWHTWNALITKNKTIDFYVEATPEDLHLKEWLQVVGWHNLPKIFRETYHIVPQSLAMTHGNEAIPSVFQSPYMRDVTTEYYDGFDYSLVPKKDMQKKQFSYLKVWNNKFVYVDWAKRQRDNTFDFHNISDSVVYFPSFYVEGGKNVPADFPFVITTDSLVRFIPNDESPISMTLCRKYFIRRDHNKYLKAMVGARFIGANQSDFSDGELICDIIDEPKMSWNSLSIKSPKAYRYIKYESPDWSHGNVGEIEFYSAGSNMPLTGTVIGTETPTTDETTREKAFDGDVLTYFDALLPHKAWIGLDFGESVTVDSIRYISRNDDNFVQKGQEYELMYADLDGWHSMGRKTADADSLVYKNVPSGAIYLLRNRSKGHEERIFSYSNGKQIWW